MRHVKQYVAQQKVTAYPAPIMARIRSVPPANDFGRLLTMRPQPPQDLCGADGLTGAHRFVPAPDLTEWLRNTFIGTSDKPGTLHNPEHEHLQNAFIGCLWTNAPNSRAQRRIVGQAELMPPGGTMGKWQKARVLQQIEGWFGLMPDFIITIDAIYAAEAGAASFCSLIEHELLHCGQELDIFGMPKFTKNGLPKFAMKGHDVEEFVSIVRRYGAGPSNAAAIIEASRKPPEIGRAQLAGACGTCLRVAA